MVKNIDLKYIEFNNDRKYNDNIITKNMIDNYHINIQNYTKFNDLVNYDNKSIRIMTYNVHYWTNANEETNIKNIINDIKKLNPDIVCLQEVTIGKNKHNQEDVGELLNPEYRILSFCNTVPSWNDVPYGNMILIKRKYENELKELIKKVYTNYPINFCDLTKEKCYYGQKNTTYDKKHNDYSETRCYIKVKLPEFNIICTHLEVNDNSSEIRIKQLTQIHEDIKKESNPTIILGDFNFVNYDDYNYNINYKTLLQKLEHPKITDNEYKYIKQLGWSDSFEKINSIPPNMTSWAGTRIDYIFFYDPNNKLIINNTGVYFSNNSDHLPVIVDIKKPYIDNNNFDEKKEIKSKLKPKQWKVIEDDNEEFKCNDELNKKINDNYNNKIYEFEDGSLKYDLKNKKVYAIFGNDIFEYGNLIEIENSQLAIPKILIPLASEPVNINYLLSLGETKTEIERDRYTDKDTYINSNINNKDFSKYGKFISLEDFYKEFYKKRQEYYITENLINDNYDTEIIKSDEIKFFNGQKASNLSYNWFDLTIKNNLKLGNEYNRGFNDPYLTGNSASELTLGINGIYMTDFSSSTNHFINIINKVNSYNFNDYFKQFYNNCGFVFEFTLNKNLINDNNFKIFKLNNSYLNEKYPKELDELCDLIYFDRYIGGPNIYKITDKSLTNNTHFALKLNNIYSSGKYISELNIDDISDDDQIMEKKISLLKTLEFENITRFILLYNIANLDKNIKIQLNNDNVVPVVTSIYRDTYKDIMEVLENNKNNFSQNTINLFKFIKNIKFNTNKNILFIPIYTNEKYEKYLDGGNLNKKNNNYYYNKYIKYKYNYIKLKNINNSYSNNL